MSTAMKIFLSMSLSGGVLILLLLLGKRLWKDTFSRRWQYYIWLIVILRLLLPFAPERTLVGTVWQAAEQSGTRMEAGPQTQEDGADAVIPGAVQPVHGSTGTQNIEERTTRPRTVSVPDPEALLCGVWLAAAAILLIRKITLYQSFVRYVRAGAVPVSDTNLLDRLSAMEEQAGVKRPVELCENPLAASPMLVGLFRPCIILPSAALEGEAFDCIALHELTHYKRRDIVYKWLAQFTVCLHWFNPAVYLMSREIEKECEFSCDEAVLAHMGYAQAPAYGKTLLNAMPAAGYTGEPLAAVSLSENKKLLKERLNAMMRFGKKPKAVWALTGVLTAGLILGAVLLGAYPAAVQSISGPEGGTISTNKGESKNTGEAEPQKAENEAELLERLEKAYENINLPVFQSLFSRLTPEEQMPWLYESYIDQNYYMFSVCLNQQKESSDRKTQEMIQQSIQEVKEQVYKDNDIRFFCMLANRMTASELETWLERAKEDEKNNFQEMLTEKLNMDGEKDALKKEWAERLREEYEAFDITTDGKNFYYFGQLVNVFLDLNPDKRHYTLQFYTLEIHPEGTVNIMTKRDNNGKLTSISTMTQEEADWWLQMLSGKDRENYEPPSPPFNEEPDLDGEVTTIPIDISTVPEDEYIWLGTWTLAWDDIISYNITAETGRRFTVGFARTEDEQPSVDSYRGGSRRTNKVPAVVFGPFQWGDEGMGDGEYNLFLYARNGPLTNVRGYVEIIKKNQE